MRCEIKCYKQVYTINEVTVEPELWILISPYKPTNKKTVKISLLNYQVCIDDSERGCFFGNYDQDCMIVICFWATQNDVERRSRIFTQMKLYTKKKVRTIISDKRLRHFVIFSKPYTHSKSSFPAARRGLLNSIFIIRMTIFKIRMWH